jgi:hypothetical protein
MGAQKIKLRTHDQAASFYLARPHTFTRRFKVWLWVLGLFGLAKKYTSMERDAKGRPHVELAGYAYKGAIYLTSQVTWEYDK